MPTPKTITAKVVLGFGHPGYEFETLADPTSGGQKTRLSDRDTFHAYAEVFARVAARLRRIGRDIDGKRVQSVGDVDGICLTGPHAVLQPLIDAGDLERMHLDGEELEDVGAEDD